MTMPAERQTSLVQIASVLWATAWRFEGGVGKPPLFDTLSARNQKRWFGAALACEHLMAQAKQDAVQETVVINSCIRVLEQHRDANTRAGIM